MNMSMDEAKKLRRAFGDAKYGCIRDVSFLAAAYIEAVDQSNYYDIALEQGQIDEETHAELQNLLLIGVLAPLRRVTPREM
jgi:hypothetical protein